MFQKHAIGSVGQSHSLLLYWWDYLFSTATFGSRLFSLFLMMNMGDIERLRLQSRVLIDWLEIISLCIGYFSPHNDKIHQGMAAGMAPSTAIEASLMAHSQPWQMSMQSLVALGNFGVTACFPRSQVWPAIHNNTVKIDKLMTKSRNRRWTQCNHIGKMEKSSSLGSWSEI